jgi:tetratricopeptide (TPR) repeat protein
MKFNRTILFQMCILTVLFLVFSYQSAFSQVQNVDKLLKNLSEYKKEDTLKANILADIAVTYFYSDREKAKSYTDSLLILSSKINFHKGKGKAYQYYSEYYLRKSDWEKLKLNLNKADSIYRMLGDELRLISVKNVYASYYMAIGEYEKALNEKIAVLRSYEKKGEKNGASKTIGTIGQLLAKLERYDEAEEYYVKAISLKKEVNDRRGESIVLANLGAMLGEQGKHNKAVVYLERALTIQKEFNDEAIIINCEANLASMYNDRKQYDKSLKASKRCYTYYFKNADTTNIVITLMYQATSYRGQKKFDDAVGRLKIAESFIKDRPSYSDLYISLMENFSTTYKQMGNTEEALGYHEKIRNLEKQQSLSAVQENISELKEKYETEKKERENLELRRTNEIAALKLQQNRYLLYGLLFVILVVVIFALLVIKNSRIRAEKEKMYLKQRLLRSQMNPHFIFNALSAIQHFMYRKEAKETGKFLTAFARMIRMTLESTQEEAVSLQKELEWLENYVRIQQLRFDNTIQYHVEIDEKIDTDNVVVPPMLIQPFIENAFEHGLSKLDEGGELNVIYSQENDRLLVRVKDNGIGFLQGENLRHFQEHESLAIKITQERLLLIGRRKQKVDFTIVSKPGEGTTVIFSIPLTYKA